jgi:glycosyltransferase involved in cell wall biosynthesis
MRILYLHQYFVTRGGVGGTRSYEFARFLVGRGHEVTMVTAAGEGAERRVTRRTVDGIELIEVRAGYSDYVGGTKLSYGRRVGSFAAFAAAATAAGVRAERPEVVYATSPPLTMALPALAASKRHRVPLVFEVRDLWPEAPIQMGALRGAVPIRLARMLERTVYRGAERVVALSPGMRDGVVAAGKDPDRVAVIPNASDLDLFSPEVDGSAMRERLDLGERFVCSYFGTMGEANDLTQVLEASRVLQQRDEDGVVFVLHGDGKRREALEARARELGLRNVVFSEPISDKRSVAELAAASHACMTIYKDVPVLYTCSPNKLFDTFAAGRPAIVNTPGWQKDLVEDNEAGLYARPGDGADLADVVLRLRDDPALVKRLGENARRLAEAEFAREKLAMKLESVLESAIQTSDS